jgi:formylglycine-generating enzyme required for sulfatase activity/outer membrane protein assembly factor BamB
VDVRRLLLTLLLLFGAVPAHSAALTNVHCRVVDYGNNTALNVSKTYYRGNASSTKITLGSEYIHYRYYSTNDPINPPWPYYDVDASSARFYGGMVGFFTQAIGDLTEGMMNANHGMRDDFNLMANASGISYNNRCYGLWYWDKADFLNGGAGGRVAFDERSMIVPHISRYFDGMGDMTRHEGGGRWVARDGTQFYMSQRTFYDYQTNIGRASALHTSYVLHPTETLWAPYNPSGAYQIVFDRASAAWAPHTFTDVTAVGFYCFKDVYSTDGIQIKWHSFEVYATVTRTNTPGHQLALQPIPAGTFGGASVPAFQMSATEIPYALWKRIYKWAASQQFCVDISLGYIFDRDGNMGSMALSTNAVHRADEPATVMTWYDAVAWCNALSEYEGVTPCYYTDAAKTNVLRWIKDRTEARYYTNKFQVFVDWQADGYRLPTMTEWAYACGSAAALPAQAWIKANASNRTHAVGLLATNQYGVGDLYGNVWEYTWDVANAGDYFAPQPLDQHTVLGGSFTYPDAPTHTPLPYGETPFNGAVDIGFRVVRGGSTPPATQTCGSVPQRTLSEGQQLPPVAPAPPPSISHLLVALRGTNSYSYWYTNETGNLAYQRSDGARVTISPFAMTRVEIPYDVWNAVYQWAVNTGYVFETDGDMGSMDYRTEDFAHSSREPVTDVNWNDALVWCNAASALDGLAPCYYADSNRTVVITAANQWRLGMEMRQSFPTWYSSKLYSDSEMYQAVFVHWDHDGYRLPTDAEWEAAYRDGQEQTPMNYPWPGGQAAAVTNYSWVAANAGDCTQPVGLKTTNSYGLCDLAGNVSEWTWDWPGFNYYIPHNPQGSSTPDFFGKAVRGANFGGPACVADERDRNQQRESETRAIIGLRVVRCAAGVHPASNVFVAPIVLNIDTADYQRLDGATHRYSLWRQGVFPVTTAAAPFSLKWTFATGSNVFSSPVVWQGVVYVGSDDGKVYALDATAGTQRWAFTANANLPVRSSATIADGFVYMGNQAGGAAGQFGYLYKLDASVGTQCWQYRYGTSRVDVDTSPAVNFGVVFARHGGTFNGVSVSNGQEVWRYRFRTLNKGPLGPSMDGGILYGPGSDNLHFAANVRDEQELWYKVGNHCAACIVLVDATRQIYAFAYSVSCRNRQTGSSIWTKNFGSGLDVTPYCTPAVGPVRLGANTSNLVFACSQTNLIAMDVNNGNKLWQWVHTAEFRSSPSLVDNVLFLGCDDGYVYALNAATGAIIWQYKTGGMVRSSPWIDAQGVLYVGSDDGTVYALNTGVPEPAAWSAVLATATGLWRVIAHKSACAQ